MDEGSAGRQWVGLYFRVGEGLLVILFCGYILISKGFNYFYFGFIL